MSTDIIAFIRARLDEWERATLADARRDDGGTCEYLLGWHLEPQEVARIISSLRAILTDVLAYEAKIDAGRCEEIAPSQIGAARHLAAIWADHPGYDPSWAAELP